jgi:hypothetical protein
MIEFTSVKLNKISVHRVGNILRDEGLLLSNEGVLIDDEITSTLLLKYFLSPFSNNEVYNFNHITKLAFNEVYSFVTEIFSNTRNFHEISIEIAKHLYDKSTHPKISGGELCVCYFNNSYFEGVQVDAIGFFKSEGKDVFLKFNSNKENYKIKHEDGVNINKLDKGCLVFNINKEDGYKICIIDSNKSGDTQYWKNEFLNLRPTSDDYHHTQNFMSIAKEFVTKQLNQEYEVTKADQIDYLNKSVDYFKANDRFEESEFTQKVFQDPSVIDSFEKFKTEYVQENNIDYNSDFDISSQAVKKQAKVFKKILKLDKNFHIYIHGNKDLIEKGIESDGRKYYKIYYKEEE